MCNKNTNIRPAIVVLAYNREKSLLRLLATLNEAKYEFDDIPLIISVDYGETKENKNVLEIARSFIWNHGYKIVRTFKQTQGLKEHFLQCGDYSIDYGAAIMLEDDVLPAPYFYSYVVQALQYYKDENRVLAISLYSQYWNGYANRPFIPINQGKDVYFSQIECSWGECYIGERWKEFKVWYKRNVNNLLQRTDIPSQILNWENSYSKYIINFFIDSGKYYITPYVSLSTNFGDVGVHFKKNETLYQVPMMQGDKKYIFSDFEESVKYDVFFENINLKHELEKKYKCNVCLDFYGLRVSYEGYDYCISAQNLPYAIMKTYGLQMRPWEENIYRQVEGEGIYMYDLKKRRNSGGDFCKLQQLRYQLYGLRWKEALYYALINLRLKFKMTSKENNIC